MPVRLYEDVKSTSEAQAQLVSQYREAIANLFKGIAPPRDFSGWTDHRFHGLLATHMFNWNRQYEVARLKGIKFDGACEFLANLGKGAAAP